MCNEKNDETPSIAFVATPQVKFFTAGAFVHVNMTLLSLSSHNGFPFHLTMLKPSSANYRVDDDDFTCDTGAAITLKASNLRNKKMVMNWGIELYY